jgi:EAL domain-containing protein (putative c-di-GMP-specific phosphodiesterase class I)
MLKELRGLLQMLDGIEDDPVPAKGTVAPAAVELPRSVEAPRARASRAPSSFIFDSDAAHAQSLSTILRATGIEPQIFGETGEFVRGLLTRAPSMVFLEVAGQGDGAIDALFAMGERNFPGGVQLMGDVSPVIDVVRRMGERHSLQMLPSIKKPVETQAVMQVLAAQDIKIAPTRSASLGEALATNLIEFWYQPKIDLGKRQIAGVETFARVRHPEFGTLPPGIFMQGATEADLLRLTERALGAALIAAKNFSDVGIHLRVAVNVPVRALVDLPILKMVAELGPTHARWPGLLLDVTVSQLAAELPRVQAMSMDLAAANVRLAIDDFGNGGLPLSAIKQLPVAELKLDRNFVNGCADDRARAKVCASVVDLAHHIGCTPVAVGIERPADMKALMTMGCDVGQGFLFGQPMPEDRLVGMLLKRAVAAPAANTQAHAGQPQRAATPDHPRQLKRAVWN